MHGSLFLQLLLVVWMFPRSLGVIFYEDEFSVRVTKLLQGLVSHELTAYLSVFNMFLIQWIMAILSKGRKPDNYGPHNPLKCSFTNIWGLCSLWIFPLIKLSWHSCSMWEKLGWLNWLWQFLCKWLSSINPKRFYHSYAYSYSLYEREAFLLHGTYL